MPNTQWAKIYSSSGRRYEADERKWAKKSSAAPLTTPNFEQLDIRAAWIKEILEKKKISLPTNAVYVDSQIHNLKDGNTASNVIEWTLFNPLLPVSWTWSVLVSWIKLMEM